MNKNHKRVKDEKVIQWARADQQELSQFDPSTKTCTMNCGPHVDDPRGDTERKFLCSDCLTSPHK